MVAAGKFGGDGKQWTLDMAMRPTLMRIGMRSGSALRAVSLDLAERPVRLRGRRVGLLDTGAEFSAAALDLIANALRQDHAAGEAHIWHNTDASVVDAMAEICDVAVCGIGACSDSVRAGVRAATALEQRGVPTASLVGRSFGTLAQATAQSRAFPALPIALLDLPVSRPDQCGAEACGMTTEIARLLTAPRAELVQEFLATLFAPPDSADLRIWAGRPVV